MNRNQAISSLQSETFDLLIIGAGASGAGCALDAALRGLKVALVDQGDFAGGTSSKSTKLIHGGVRYLEQAFKKLDPGQLKQVRHGLEEREILLQNAPHLSRPLALVTPVFSWWEGFYYSIGLKLYGWFAGFHGRLPASRWLSRKEALEMVPGLNRRIHSAVMYYDGQMDDARYCLALVQSALEVGVVVANHVKVIDFQKDNAGKLNAAVLKDAHSGQIFHARARVILNCTGPFSDQIARMASAAHTDRIRPSKGVHVVLPLHLLGASAAMLIPKTSDGRMVFAIPFQDQLLLGTTDDPWTGGPEEPVLESKEIDFLLETLSPFLDQSVDRGQIQAGFGGLRPLLAAKDRKTKNMLRDHEVSEDSDAGLISLLGGKWTTYRLMAKDAIDAVCARLGLRVDCRTAHHALAGAEGFDPEMIPQIQTKYTLPEPVCRHLVFHYGGRVAQVLALLDENPAWKQRLHPDFPFLQADVVFALRFEMALELRDVLAHRLRLEILDWRATLAVLETVAGLMAAELGWTDEESGRQVDTYRKLILDFIVHTGVKIE